MPPGPSATWTPWPPTCPRSTRRRRRRPRGPRPPARPPGRARPAPGGPAKAALIRTVLWFGMISVVLLVVWAMTGADYFWPIWPILGFLIAVGWQAFAVYGPGAVDDDRRPPGSP